MSKGRMGKEKVKVISKIFLCFQLKKLNAFLFFFFQNYYAMAKGERERINRQDWEF